MDFVSIAMRDGMHGNVQLLAGSLDQDFVNARRNGRQEFAVGRGAEAFVVPVTPMNSSALSYHGDISS